MTDSPEAVMARALSNCEKDGLLAIENETVIRDQIAGLHAAGYAIVPAELSGAMNEALYGPWLSSAAHTSRLDAYRAMLAAVGDEDDS